ncbi:MAG: NUDIX domain-containing protein [Alistipes indistinctus]
MPGLRYGDGAPPRDFEALSDLRQRAVSGYLSGNHRTDLQRGFDPAGPHLLFPVTFHGTRGGFLETGESLEACVHREVFEETGLQIRNLRYFGNQPWPYPSGLMVGFIADYAAGEIRLQRKS